MRQWRRGRKEENKIACSGDETEKEKTRKHTMNCSHSLVRCHIVSSLPSTRRIEYPEVYQAPSRKSKNTNNHTHNKISPSSVNYEYIVEIINDMLEL